MLVRFGGRRRIGERVDERGWWTLKRRNRITGRPCDEHRVKRTDRLGAVRPTDEMRNRDSEKNHGEGDGHP